MGQHGSQSDDPKPPSDSEDSASRGGECSNFEFVRQGSSEEVFHRLIDGDPLHIRERCVERVKARLLLLSLDVLMVRAIGRTAEAAPGYDGDLPPQEWLDQWIDSSIDVLLREERELDRGGLPPDQPLDTHFAFLSEALGIEPTLTRRGCIVFNGLPREQREVFWRLIVERMSIADYEARGHGSREEALHRLRKTMSALSQLQDEGSDLRSDQ